MRERVVTAAAIHPTEREGRIVAAAELRAEVQQAVAPVDLTAGAPSDAHPDRHAEGGLKINEINVETFKGRVQLSGFVRSRAGLPPGRSSDSLSNNEWRFEIYERVANG